jgi:hypothetical protein
LNAPGAAQFTVLAKASKKRKGLGFNRVHGLFKPAAATKSMTLYNEQVSLQLDQPHTYLAQEGENQVVDTSISLKSRGEAGEKNCMVHKQVRCLWIVKMLPYHVHLIISEVATGDGQCTVGSRPRPIIENIVSEHVR